VKKDGAGLGMTPMPAPSVPAITEDDGEVRKTPTAPTAPTLKCKKGLVKRRLLHDSPRSLSPAAVDMAVSAHGSYDEYRPHESPANGRITSGAGVAGGILLDVTPGNILRTAPDLLASTIVLQSRLECRSSRGVGPRRPEDLMPEAVAQISLYAHRGQDKSKAC
jgi:hypothetical protein